MEEASRNKNKMPRNTLKCLHELVFECLMLYVISSFSDCVRERVFFKGQNYI